MNTDFEIRPISEADIQSVLNIYSYYVNNTVISFEYESPTLAEYRQRVQEITGKYPWLVCAFKGEIIGFAYGSTHRHRTAYQWSPESTIYLAAGFHSKGIGSILYQTLFALLRLQGYFNVYAGVSLPNEKSAGFHRAMGFETIGIFKKAGYKQGNWHDTLWFQLQLSEHQLNPPPPLKPENMISTPEYLAIMHSATQTLQSYDTSASL